MTLDCRHYCRLAAGGTAEGVAPVQLGEADSLTLVWLQRGHCALQGAYSGLLPPSGIVAAAAPPHLAPVGGCALVWVSLRGAAPAEMAAQLEGPLLLAPAGADFLAAAAALRRLADLASAPGAASALSHADACLQSALGYELLCHLAALPPQGQALPELITAAIALIRAHYAEVFGVEELAQQLGVSKGHLIRRFTAATGLSPGRFLTAVRIEAAKGLLLHRQYPLEAVAGLCGFSGANYFCRVFRREEGLTPAAWRRAHAAGEQFGPPAPLPIELEESLFL